MLSQKKNQRKCSPPSLAFFYQIQVVLEEQLTGNKGRLEGLPASNCFQGKKGFIFRFASLPVKET